jgi:hypothetical protein
MALEDLQSAYGPTNKKGDIGTGAKVDVFAGEGAKNLGHETKFQGSKYSGAEKIGQKPTAPDVFGNIPAERSGEGK